MKEFADDSFKFDKNERKFLKWVENALGKGAFSHSVFKRLELQTQKKETQPLFGKGLNFASLKCNFQLKLKYLRMGHEARPTVFICLVFTGKKRRQRDRKTREVKKYSNGHERPVYR